MPQDPMDMEQDQTVQASSDKAATAARLPRLKALALACAILALPLAYLVMYYGMPRDVAAGTETPAQNIAARINIALVLIHNNQPNRAVPLLESIVAADASNAVVWNDLCVAHTMEKSYRQAIAECTRAIRLQPNFQLAKNNLNWAAGEFAKSRQSIARQEQTAPPARDANFYLAEGMNFLHLGNYDEAIRAWQRTLTLDPHSAVAANNIGTALMFKKQPAEAKAWFQKAITLDPALQIARNNLNWAEVEMKKQAQSADYSASAAGKTNVR